MFEMRVKGLKELEQQFRIIAKATTDELQDALVAEAEIELAEAKRRTPVKYGPLRASGHVVPPKTDNRSINVKVAFGGPSAPYAIYVHENMEAFHKTGQAKFLESVLLESAPHMAARIAARLRTVRRNK